MGRRRKRRKRLTTRRIVKKPARYFNCPICNQPTLTIDFRKGEGGKKIAVVKCGTCKLSLEMEVPEIYERVDVYARIIDMAEEGVLESYVGGGGEAEEAAAEAEAAEAEEGEAGSVEAGEGAEVPTREEV